VQRLFHPDAASEQKQVIHCSALDPAALCSTAIAVIQALFPSLEGSKGMFNLYFVIPAVSARLSMGEGQVLAQLSAAHTIVFHLRDPHRLSPSERLLAATGSMSVLPAGCLLYSPIPFSTCPFHIWTQELDAARNSSNSKASWTCLST
jgi:hypothetical protein